MVAPGQQIRCHPQPLTGAQFEQRLKEISMFFQGNDAVHQTMRRVVAAFERENISCALVSGMAVSAHQYRRTRGDVIFLLTQGGLNSLRELVERASLPLCPVGRGDSLIPSRV